MPQNIGGLILVAGIMFAVLVGITTLSNFYSLNIKVKIAGHGQHGTARWTTSREITRTYTYVNFTPALWREGTVGIWTATSLCEKAAPTR